MDNTKVIFCAKCQKDLAHVTKVATDRNGHTEILAACPTVGCLRVIKFPGGGDLDALVAAHKDANEL